MEKNYVQIANKTLLDHSRPVHLIKIMSWL